MQLSLKKRYRVLALRPTGLLLLAFESSSASWRLVSSLAVLTCCLVGIRDINCRNEMLSST